MKNDINTFYKKSNKFIAGTITLFIVIIALAIIFG